LGFDFISPLRNPARSADLQDGTANKAAAGEKACRASFFSCGV
jgi:hypothetical protein